MNTDPGICLDGKARIPVHKWDALDPVRHIEEGVIRCEWDTGEHAPVPVFMAFFDARRFAYRQFAEAGIACPAQVQRGVGKRQAEFFFGRLCARAALGNLGSMNGDVPIGASREPLWPAGTIGSITHTDTIAAALVLPEREYRGIGIDIERVDPAAVAHMPGIVLSSSELDYLESLQPQVALNASMTLVFSMKESFFKATYAAVKEIFEFEAVRISQIDVVRRTVSFVLTRTLCDALPMGLRCTGRFEMLGGQHVATVFLWRHRMDGGA